MQNFQFLQRHLQAPHHPRYRQVPLSLRVSVSAMLEHQKDQGCLGFLSFSQSLNLTLLKPLDLSSRNRLAAPGHPRPQGTPETRQL